MTDSVTASQPSRFAALSRLSRSMSATRQADPNRTASGVILALVGPAVVIYLVFTLYPVLRTFWNSVHTIRPHGVSAWVGLGNFRELLNNDPVFWIAVSNTALFAVVATVADVLGGLLLALCLFAKVPLARLLRIVWFTPVLMSYVVVGVIWVWIFDFDWGTLNTVLRWLGLDALTRSWLGDPHWALWAVMIAHLWKWLGFNMIIFLAALYALPCEVLGAAELDNCGWLAKLVYVIIPMLRPTIVNLLVLSFIGKMMIFDLVWIMTAGGPLWSTETVSTYVYKRAFDWNTFDLGYPSAIAVVWCVLILFFVAAMSRLLRSRERLEF
jgi:ABC-type sugar transport system permease subunit